MVEWGVWMVTGGKEIGDGNFGLEIGTNLSGVIGLNFGNEGGDVGGDVGGVGSDGGDDGGDGGVGDDGDGLQLGQQLLQHGT